MELDVEVVSWVKVQDDTDESHVERLADIFW